MNNRILRLKSEFTKLRSSRPSSDMFNHVTVEAYGATVTLPEVSLALTV